MKMSMSAIFTVLLSLIVVSPLMAQGPPDPQNYHLIYGNRDASPFVVTPGETILLPIWGATDPNPNSADTVTFLHNPLLSRNLYIYQRLGGDCVICDQCDSCCAFSMPENMGPPYGGYTNQSMLLYAYLNDPRNGCVFYTLGDTVLLGYFQMRITADSAYSGQTVDAFLEGHGDSDTQALWSMQDGISGVIPTISISQLYFSPCFYTCGDANNDNTFDGLDIVFAINYFKGPGAEPPYSCNCPGYGSPRLAADTNGDCRFSGIDVTYGVNFLKGRGPAPRRCPGC